MAIDDDNHELELLVKHSKKFKLLTTIEERELMWEYKSYRDEIAFLEKRIANARKYKKIPSKKNMTKLNYTISLKKKLRERLLSCNFRLIIKIAKQPNWQGKGLDQIDLIQEGMDGFMYSLELFDPSKGFKLSTYSTTWIKQKIGRALENKSKLVRIPNHKLALMSKLKTIYRQFLEKECRLPNTSEIIVMYKKKYKKEITLEQIQESGRLDFTHVSLDETTGEGDEGISIVNYLTYEQANQPEERAERLWDKYYMQILLERLPKNEADFLKLRYGFLDHKERSHKEMIQFTGKTIKENEQFERDVLAKLRVLANKHMVNSEVLCDLILINGARDRLVSCLKLQEALGVSLVLAAEHLKKAPVRIKSKISQHRAEELAEDLRIAGIQTSIVEVV